MISQLLDKLGFRGSHELANYAVNLARKIVAFALIAHIQVSTGWQTQQSSMPSKNSS